MSHVTRARALRDAVRPRVVQAGPVRRICASTTLVMEALLLGFAVVRVQDSAAGWELAILGLLAIVALLLPGDMCDPFVFRRARMDHAIGALTPVTVARITPEQMSDAVRGRPVIEECLWRETLSTVAIHREWIASVGRRSAIERLAHLFCELHLRLARVGLADGTTLPMPVTQPDLADALGQTSVHINRTLKELRTSGLVTLRSRRLAIRDLGALMERGLFDPAYLQLT